MQHIFKYLITLLIAIIVVPAQGEAQSHAFELGSYLGHTINAYGTLPMRRPHQAVALTWTNRHYSYWYKAWHEPEVGLTVSYHDFGNPDVLGEGIGVQYQLGLKNRFKPKWRYFGRIRLGGIFHTKKYHPTKNPENIVTGSNIAFLTTASGGLEYKPSTRSRLLLEASFWHSSNAQIKLPNAGMTSLMVSLAYRYYLQEEAYLNVPKPVDTNQRVDWKPMAYFAYGLNQNGYATETSDRDQYDKYLLGFGFQKRYKPAFRLMLSVEAYYDEAYRKIVDDEQLVAEGENEFLQSSAVMVMLGHEFIYNHFGLIFQGGVNVYNPTRDDQLNKHQPWADVNGVKRLFPGRFAVRYYFFNLWNHFKSPFLQLGVKSNFIQADFLEFGTGFTL